MTTNGYFFTRDEAGSYHPVQLQVRSVTRDGQGSGSVEVTLSTGEKVSLHAEFDPGLVIAGATFYATIEPGNRLVEIPWHPAPATPEHTARVQEVADALRLEITSRVTRLRGLLSTLQAAPLPSAELLDGARDTIRALFSQTASTGYNVAPVPVMRAKVCLSGARPRGNRDRSWQVELRPADNVTGKPVKIAGFRDTGADIPCISANKASELGLQEVGLVDISGITATPERLSRVRLHVTLPRFGVAEVVDAAVVPDLVRRCGKDFLIDDHLSALAEENMGVA